MLDGKKDPNRRRVIEQGGAATFDLPSGTYAEYRKTSTTFATRMEEPFEVDTPEGLMVGKAGDWLAVGQAGELYPIDAAVFAATYEPVE